LRFFCKGTVKKAGTGAPAFSELELPPPFHYLSWVRVFKNRWFSRFAAREGIEDCELKGMAGVLDAGQGGTNKRWGFY
jgi:hypothetical protein